MSKLNHRCLSKNFPTGADLPTHGNSTCALRMGIVLQKCGIDLSKSNLRRYKELYEDKYICIRSAHQTALYLKKYSIILGLQKPKVTKDNSLKKFRKNPKGFVFIKNKWGTTDHIDLWDGHKLNWATSTRGYLDWKGEIWFFKFDQQ